MRCSLIHKLSSAYLDGELDDARSSAVRGHLRACESCAERVADEQAAARAAAELASASDPMLEPTASLWEKIGQRLAAEEIADSQVAPVRLRARSALATIWPFRAHLAVAVMLSVVVGALIVKQRSGVVLVARRGVQDAPQPVFAATGADRAGESHFNVVASEIRRADERYMTTIARLRELAASEQDGWSAAAKQRFDDSVSKFETEAATLHSALDAASDIEPRSRDGLYQLYRSYIKFLESALFDRVSQVDSGGSQ